jgi:GntR family transcriptional regulator
MTDSDTLGFKPLYSQVKDIFIRRIAEGTWGAGSMIPSETVLAADLKVSQGTVRKALDELTAENLLTRRQGVGTFVAKHDENRILFQFFKLQSDNGERAFPESEIINIVKVAASADEQRILNLTSRDDVVRIKRVRLLNGRRTLVEDVILPAKTYPDIEKTIVPNNLYGIYSSIYGVTIARASERLKAVNANAGIAKILDIKEGTALLLIDRVAIAIDGRVAEWRLSYCLSDDFHYASDLR